MVNDQPGILTTGYLPNGAKVTFNIPLIDLNNAYAEALAFTSKLLADGWLLNAPGLEDGEQSEPIVIVMRRAKSDGTPIIDFYPAWGAGNDEPYGTYKYLHQYLNDDNEINEFLAIAGFKSLEDIPLYDGQSPLKRTPNKRHPKETPVNKPFKIVRKQGIEKIGSDGKPYRPWELVRYEPVVNITKLDTTANASISHQEGATGDLAQAAGDYEPRTPQQRLNGNGAPAKGQQKRMATEPPKEGGTRDFQVTSVTVKMKDGHPRYAMTATDHSTVWAYSRDVFRAMGYDENVIEDWGAKEQTIKFSQKMPVRGEWKLYKDSKDGNGYWSAQFDAVTVDQAAKEIPF